MIPLVLAAVCSTAGLVGVGLGVWCWRGRSERARRMAFASAEEDGGSRGGFTFYAAPLAGFSALLFAVYCLTDRFPLLDARLLLASSMVAMVAAWALVPVCDAVPAMRPRWARVLGGARSPAERPEPRWESLRSALARHLRGIDAAETLLLCGRSAGVLITADRTGSRVRIVGQDDQVPAEWLRRQGFGRTDHSPEDAARLATLAVARIAAADEPVSLVLAAGTVSPWLGGDGLAPWQRAVALLPPLSAPGVASALRALPDRDLR